MCVQGMVNVLVMIRALVILVLQALIVPSRLAMVLQILIQLFAMEGVHALSQIIAHAQVLGEAYTAMFHCA